MSASLSQYMVYCITEDNTVFTDYRLDVPTTCPHNIDHKIDPSRTIIIDTIKSNTVVVDENSPTVTTGEYYRADQFELNVPAGKGATASYDISYPYNIGVYSATFFSTEVNIGDSFELIAYPDTPAGTISSDIEAGSTQLIISSASTLNPGFYVSISDGKNSDNLGEIVSIDKTTNTITFSKPCTNLYSLGSVVTFSIPRIKNGKIINTNDMYLGFSKIGCAGLPAGRIVRLNYTNSTDQEKTLNFVIELQY